ncbi:MAG: hypothetical protein JO313_09230, partial [Verrucomicrobia bacterium]|nr:hypothetical protein [Verrucomicrobiota bacterium]
MKRILPGIAMLLTITCALPHAAIAEGATQKLKFGLVLINLQAKFFNDI